jgi:hypothetical protein
VLGFHAFSCWRPLRFCVGIDGVFVLNIFFRRISGVPVFRFRVYIHPVTPCLSVANVFWFRRSYSPARKTFHL